MDLLIVADGHYYKTNDGTIYVDSVYDYNFYKRYLSVFDHLYAVARIENVNVVPEGRKVSSGEGIDFLELPNYRGIFQYFKKYFTIKKYVKLFCRKGDCAIFRIPAATSNTFFHPYKKTKKPYAVELVADPWENFAPGSIDSLFRPLIRIVWTKLVKDMCMSANGASYVTSYCLQEKYPCQALTKKKGFTASYSSVELADDSFAEPKQFFEKKVWIISHVANTFSDNGKGHKPLMQAVRIVRDNGYDIRIRFIGDGPKKNEFINIAKELHICDFVEFLGKLPSGKEVREKIADTDLFVFPTKAEGLPRGLLEAMAEGLPCLSSPVGGIPEILESEFLYAYNDIDGFAQGIINFISNPQNMTKASAHNIEIAKKYSSSILNTRRKEFYKCLLDCVQ